MTWGLMRCPLVAASLLVGTVAVAHATPAAGGKPGACGVKILPLAVGNTWKYEFVAPDQKLDEKVAKLYPAAYAKIAITVKAIDTKDKATVVTLEEKLTSQDLLTAKATKDKPGKIDERTITTTITCDGAKRFDISPDSFLFAGEPGGFVNMTFDKLDRPKGSTWQLANGTFGEGKWREDVVAHWVRTPTDKTGAKAVAGKLELEREFTPQQPENIAVLGGKVYRAEKLGLSTTGRVTLDEHHALNTKPVETPANWFNTLWFATDVGLVQVTNAFNHKYQLVEFAPAK